MATIGLWDRNSPVDVVETWLLVVSALLRELLKGKLEDDCIVELAEEVGEEVGEEVVVMMVEELVVLGGAATLVLLVLVVEVGCG